FSRPTFMSSSAWPGSWGCTCLRHSSRSGGLLETGQQRTLRPSSARSLPARGAHSSPGNPFQYTLCQSPVQVEERLFRTLETTPTFPAQTLTSLLPLETATSLVDGTIMR